MSYTTTITLKTYDLRASFDFVQVWDWMSTWGGGGQPGGIENHWNVITPFTDDSHFSGLYGALDATEGPTGPFVYPSQTAAHQGLGNVSFTVVTPPHNTASYPLGGGTTVYEYECEVSVTTTDWLLFNSSLLYPGDIYDFVLDWYTDVGSGTGTLLDQPGEYFRFRGGSSLWPFAAPFGMTPFTPPTPVTISAAMSVGNTDLTINLADDGSASNYTLDTYGWRVKQGSTLIDPQTGITTTNSDYSLIGSSGSAAVPAEGSYTVELWVIDAKGYYATASEVITIASGAASLLYDPHSGVHHHFYIAGSEGRVTRNYNQNGWAINAGVNDFLIASGATAVDGFRTDRLIGCVYTTASGIYVVLSTDEGATWGSPMTLASGYTQIGKYFDEHSSTLYVLAKNGAGAAYVITSILKADNTWTTPVVTAATGLPSGLSGGGLAATDGLFILTAKNGSDIERYTSDNTAAVTWV